MGTTKRYRKVWEHVPSRSGGGDPISQPTPQPFSQPTPCPFSPINIKLDDLPWDPSARPIIYSYDPNIVEEIKRIGGDPVPQPTPQPISQPTLDHGAGDAFTVVNPILEDIGDNVFSLLVDVSSDVPKKEQMAMLFRYLDRHGVV
ncbi:zinc finger MYM-type protein 1-like protein [Tanacetum coccineum]